MIPYLIINSINKNKTNIQSASKRLDSIFISDIGHVYNQTIKYIDKFDKNEVINIASGIFHIIKEIYLKISSILGKIRVKFVKSDLSELKGSIKSENSY